MDESLYFFDCLPSLCCRTYFCHFDESMICLYTLLWPISPCMLQLENSLFHPCCFLCKPCTYFPLPLLIHSLPLQEAVPYLQHPLLDEIATRNSHHMILARFGGYPLKDFTYSLQLLSFIDDHLYCDNNPATPKGLNFIFQLGFHTNLRGANNVCEISTIPFLL